MILRQGWGAQRYLFMLSYNGGPIISYSGVWNRVVTNMKDYKMGNYYLLLSSFFANMVIRYNCILIVLLLLSAEWE